MPLDNRTATVYYINRSVARGIFFFFAPVVKMFIEIDTGSNQPIFEQIAMQLKFSIASGAIRPGEMIPSVREMARRTAVNPNTIARAYRVLQDEGIVYVRRGTGMAVDDEAPEKCRAERKNVFVEKFNRFLAEAVQSRLPEGEISEIIGGGERVNR